MNAKLTLSLDKSVIDRAKAFAIERKMSLSALIENLLLEAVSDPAGPDAYPRSAVKELTGIVNLDSENPHGLYQSYLEEKHR